MGSRRNLSAAALLLITACGGAPETPPAAVAPPAALDVDPYTALMYRFQEGKPLPSPAFALISPGSPDPVDYEAFGAYQGEGTPDFTYIVKDFEGLKKAMGTGIYPNADAIVKEPEYERLRAAGALDSSHWDAIRVCPPAAAVCIWATAQEEEGVKTYNTALAFERAGLLMQAVKGYQAVVVHYPRSSSVSINGDFIWYLAPAAITRIRTILRDFPQLGWVYEGAQVVVENGMDIDQSNDVVSVTPGRFVRRSLNERHAARVNPAGMSVVETRGKGRVQVVKLENGHWQMRVDGRPFAVRGITYAPTKIGVGPVSDRAFGERWMFNDDNRNERIDAPYEAWVDANGNGRKDADEPSVGDFQLMKEMGVNAIRLYTGKAGETTYVSAGLNKELLRDLFNTYGIRVIVGDFLGAYTVGSGATWDQGTDYTDPVQRARMKEVVRQKVLDLKDEPFVLMWVLGNENNMLSAAAEVNATRTNAGRNPRAWAEFLNEVAAMIHEIDPNHPVAVGNLEIGLADVYARYAPEIDVFGVNSYRGQYGFGSLWTDAKRLFDRPVLITENGCDAFSNDRKAVDEEAQAFFLENNLRDVVFNQAGGEEAGNSVGIVVFEYVDEWWKDAYSGGEGEREDRHQYNCMHKGPMPDERFHEEWFGIMGQGSGANSPFERVIRKAYHYFKNVWGS